MKGLRNGDLQWVGYFRACLLRKRMDSWVSSNVGKWGKWRMYQLGHFLLPVTENLNQLKQKENVFSRVTERPEVGLAAGRA